MIIKYIISTMQGENFWQEKREEWINSLQNTQSSDNITNNIENIEDDSTTLRYDEWWRTSYSYYVEYLENRAVTSNDLLMDDNNLYTKHKPEYCNKNIKCTKCDIDCCADCSDWFANTESIKDAQCFSCCLKRRL